MGFQSIEEDMNRRGRPQSQSSHPEPLTCGHCGSVRTWAIWPTTNSPHFGKAAPRWCRPRVDPCKLCEEETQKADLEHRLFSGQARAGIGERDRDWRWDRTRLQRSNEMASSFMARVRAIPAATIGVLKANEDAFRDLAQWTPASGYSIYVQGRPGCGKTVAAAALATRLLGGTEATRYWLTEEEGQKRHGSAWDRIRGTSRASVMRMGQTWGPRFVTESDLVERQRLKWSKDREPLGQIVDRPCLIFDDLGESGVDPLTERKQPYGYIELVQRLIRRRYAKGLPMVITSNVPMEPVKQNGKTLLSGVRDWYGDRVYSRLQEMCRGHVWTLQNVDWRAS